MSVDPVSGAPTLAERLARLDTCAVSDALDRLGLPGAVIGLRPMWPCPRIAGRVITVKLKPAGGDRPARHLGTAAVEAAEAGDVIVIDHAGRAEMAGWGGILSLAAKLKGVGGVIVDGACRDVDESRDVSLPVYARSATPVTARGRVVEESFNEPIEIGGIAVRPGDLVIADWTGVVFVAAARAEEIVRAAELIAEREAQMAAAVRAGRSVVEVMGASYESMLGQP
jgi:regulator of RNase E activity RraA